MLISPSIIKGMSEVPKVPEEPVRITKPLVAVLDALLGAENHELHGWAIMKSTGKAGPTIYKILERLTGAGWVEWRWEELSGDEARPRRRYYRLTGLGVTRAQGIVAQRQRKAAPSRFRLAFGGCDF
jgi:PadR family transcriptional regulator, regulatory protein PadR